MADEGKLTQLWRDLGNTGDRPAGWYGPNGSPSNPVYTVEQARSNELASKMAAERQAGLNAATSSLQSSIPEIQKKYAAQGENIKNAQASLKDRYDAILQDIGNRQTADVNSQTRVTAGELGKRGIQGSSTLAQQEIQNAVQPINSQYAGLATNARLNQEDAYRGYNELLSNLTSQETEQERAVQNAIAQLQYNSGNLNASDLLNNFQLQQQASQQASENAFRQQQLAAQQKQQDFENSYASQVQPLQLQLLQKQVANAYKPAESYGNESNILASIFGGGVGNRPDLSSFEYQDNQIRGGR